MFLKPSPTVPLTELLRLRAKLMGGPRHGARASLVTKHRERVAEREHHMWAAQGLDRPTHRGRHASDAPAYRDAEQPAAVTA